MSGALRLVGADGRPRKAWRNPSLRPGTLARAEPLGGMRGLLGADDLWIWPGAALPHDAFTRQTGITGLRLRLREGAASANLEAVAQPDLVPWAWCGRDPEAMDMEERREALEAFIRASPRVAAVLPAGFALDWHL